MKSGVATVIQTSTTLGEFMATVAALAIINALIMVPTLAVIREFINEVA